MSCDLPSQPFPGVWLSFSLVERHKNIFFLELTPSLPDDLPLHLSMGELNLPMVSWSGQPMNFIGQLTKKLMKQVYLGQGVRMPCLLGVV